MKTQNTTAGQTFGLKHQTDSIALSSPSLFSSILISISLPLLPPAAAAALSVSAQLMFTLIGAKELFMRKLK